VTSPESGRGSWEWAACGASVTGSDHLRRGLGCDDAYGYSVLGDYVVAAVADGAGSVTGTSAWGSYAACRHILYRATTPGFVRDLRDATEGEAADMMRWLFETTLEAVTRQADALGLPVAQLATTLCVAASTPELTVFGQIGDGIIASKKKDVIATHLIEEKSEYANTTWFLHSEGAFEESFRTSTHTGLTALALSTDGMTYKITNVSTGEAYEPFFSGSWQHVRAGASAAEFAALLRGIKDDQTGDDKTMVLATLNWVEDKHYPSARPVCKTIVHSPPPQAPLREAAPTSRAEISDPARESETLRSIDHRPLANISSHPLSPDRGTADVPARLRMDRGDTPREHRTAAAGERRRLRRTRHSKH
jgi:hypothetical protein